MYLLTDEDKIYSIRYYSYLINKEKLTQYLIFLIWRKIRYGYLGKNNGFFLALSLIMILSSCIVNEHVDEGNIKEMQSE